MHYGYISRSLLFFYVSSYFIPLLDCVISFYHFFGTLLIMIFRSHLFGSKSDMNRAVAIITKMGNCGINKLTEVDGKLPSLSHVISCYVKPLGACEFTVNKPFSPNHSQERLGNTKLTRYIEEDLIDSKADPLGWWHSNQGGSPPLSKSAH